MSLDWIEIEPASRDIVRRYVSSQMPEPQKKGNIVLAMKVEVGQRLVYEGLDAQGQPINPSLIVSLPKVRDTVLEEDELIMVSRQDWKSMQDRVLALESKKK
jgi:hypothetical protein